MARVRLSQTWPDGSAIVVEVEVAESYPDAVAEARANARALWSDVDWGCVDKDDDD